MTYTVTCIKRESSESVPVGRNTGPVPLDDAEAARNQYQENALLDGFTLAEKRYALRPFLDKAKATHA